MTAPKDTSKASVVLTASVPRLSFGDIRERILDRLKQSSCWTERTKIGGTSISPLVCPECGKAEAWAYSKDPFAIICNRNNKCGARTKTLELFPDLKTRVEEHYKPTTAEPDRPATAFLLMRGIDAALEGLAYRYERNARRIGGAVMFPVAPGVENGRIFNPPQGEGKTHNIGSTSGVFWRHPGIPYDSDKETFVTEGIIDALSLIEMGFQAIAVLSSGADPGKLDLSAFGKLVTAFDRDQAGTRATKKWRDFFETVGGLPEWQARTISAIIPDEGDWNDLLRSLGKERALITFEEKRPLYELQAHLAMAESALKYAQLYHEFHHRAPGLFTFGRCFFFSEIKKERDELGQPREVVYAHRVSNFTLDVDHYQLDATNPEEPINRYFLRISPKEGREVACSITANELSTPTNLRTVFLARARVLWEGDNKPSLALMRRITEAKAPVVRQLQTVGYDATSGCYVFKQFLVNQKGEIVRPNKQGFFEVSRHETIRPANHPTVNPEPGTSPAEIWKLLYGAWGDRAATAIAWTVASWWVNQIKTACGFFPFLSLCGDTQTGKTRLTRFLNALQALDEEGLPMAKTNTGKGEIRKLAQRSGLFKALLEANNTDKARFDFESILPLYNENPLQVSALKTTDIQTRETPFLASLAFVQNKEPFKSKAQKERVISVPFKTEDVTTATAEAFNRLVQIPLPRLAWFFVEVMRHRQDIEAKWMDEHTKAKDDLAEAIPDNRINENHALILAFHRLLCQAIGVDHDLKPYLAAQGKAKAEECNKRYETVADLFLDALMGMGFDEEDDPCISIDRDKGLIFVRLAEALKRLNGDGSRFNFQVKDLQASLREHPAYIESNKLHRFKKDDRAQSKAWVFDLGQLDK